MNGFVGVFRAICTICRSETCGATGVADVYSHEKPVRRLLRIDLEKTRGRRRRPVDSRRTAHPREGWLTRRAGQEVIDMVRALALMLFFSLGVSLSYGTADSVLAKKDATASKDASASEDGQSSTDEGSVEGSATLDGSSTTTTTAPTVPVGANLTPPVGALPPIVHPAGTGQSGSSSVSMAPGTLTSGVAREDRNAVHSAPAEPAPEAAPEAAAPAGWPK